MRSNQKVRQAIEEYRQGFIHFENANNILSCGPSSYYLDKLDEYVEALFERFSPFRVDDRVELIKTPRIEESSGWYGSRHFLVTGSKGIVRDIDYGRTNGFVADVEFDDESWIDQQGVIQPPSNKHVYAIGEKLLKKI